MQNFIKIVKRLQRYRKSLNISLLWPENGYLHYIRCFGVKNEKKWKLSAMSSLYECTDQELKLQWLICIVAANFYQNQWNNSWDIALTIFFNGSVHHLDFFKLTLWTTVMLEIANVCHHVKFHQNWSNVCKYIVKVWIFH